MKKKWKMLIITFIIINIVAFIMATVTKADYRPLIACDILIVIILLMFAALVHRVKSK
jgi:uncharacterized membrane protein YccC